MAGPMQEKYRKEKPDRLSSSKIVVSVGYNASSYSTSLSV